ncbi:MAG TPA: sulfotransferase [Rhodothermales bacterium]|nr:sulfotransferase [Rhodothermales bacterium]
MTTPNFLIVGAAKAGTTSLYHYLRQHPDVFMPEALKESFFLSGLSPTQFVGPGRQYGSRMITTWEAYQDLFAGSADCPARGEACVAYLYFTDETIASIRQWLGRDVRIIISLRDPVGRAYSNYLHHVGDGIEPLPFEEAVEASGWRRKAGWWWGFDYLEVGFYYRQVKAYLDAFGAEQVLILLHGDLEADVQGTLSRIFRFLGVEATFVPDVLLRHNVTGLPRSEWIHSIMAGTGRVRNIFKNLLPIQMRRRLKHLYIQKGLARPPLAPEMRRRLIETYKSDVQRLQALIERDLSRWLV